MFHSKVTFLSESSFGGNPVTISSHSSIDTWLVLFSTSITPTYYSNKFPDISRISISQWSTRIILEAKEEKKTFLVLSTNFLLPLLQSVQQPLGTENNLPSLVLKILGLLKCQQNSKLEYITYSGQLLDWAALEVDFIMSSTLTMVQVTQLL